MDHNAAYRHHLSQRDRAEAAIRTARERLQQHQTQVTHRRTTQQQQQQDLEQKKATDAIQRARQRLLQHSIGAAADPADTQRNNNNKAKAQAAAAAHKKRRSSSHSSSSSNRRRRRKYRRTLAATGTKRWRTKLHAAPQPPSTSTRRRQRRANANHGNNDSDTGSSTYSSSSGTSHTTDNDEEEDSNQDQYLEDFDVLAEEVRKSRTMCMLHDGAAQIASAAANAVTNLSQSTITNGAPSTTSGATTVLVHGAVANHPAGQPGAIYGPLQRRQRRRRRKHRKRTQKDQRDEEGTVGGTTVLRRRRHQPKHVEEHALLLDRFRRRQEKHAQKEQSTQDAQSKCTGAVIKAAVAERVNVPPPYRNIDMDMHRVRSVMHKALTSFTFHDKQSVEALDPYSIQGSVLSASEKVLALNRDILGKFGLSSDTVNRLLRSLIVYSNGFHDLIADIASHPGVDSEEARMAIDPTMKACEKKQMGEAGRKADTRGTTDSGSIRQGENGRHAEGDAGDEGIAAAAPGEDESKTLIREKRRALIAHIWKAFVFLLNHAVPSGSTYEIDIATIERLHRIQNLSIVDARDRELSVVVGRERDLSERARVLAEVIQKLQTVRQETDKQRLQLVREVSRRRADLKAVRLEIDAMMSRKHAARAACHRAVSKYKLVGEDRLAVELSITCLQRDLEAAEASLSQIRDKKNIEASRYSKVAVMLESRKHSHSRLLADLDRLNQKLKYNSTDQKQHEEEIGELRERKETLENQIEAVIRERDECVRFVENSRAAYQQLNRQKHAEEERIASIHYRVRQLKAENNGLQSQLTTVTQERDEVRNARDEAEMALFDERARLQSLVESKSMMETTLANQNAIIEIRKQETVEVRSKTTDAERERDRLQALLEKAKERLRVADRVTHKTKKMLSQAHTRVQKETGDHSGIAVEEEKIEDSELEMNRKFAIQRDTIVKQLSDLRGSIETARRRIAELDDESKDTRAKVDAESIIVERKTATYHKRKARLRELRDRLQVLNETMLRESEKKIRYVTGASNDISQTAELQYKMERLKKVMSEKRSNHLQNMKHLAAQQGTVTSTMESRRDRLNALSSETKGIMEAEGLRAREHALRMNSIERDLFGVKVSHKEWMEKHAPVLDSRKAALKSKLGVVADLTTKKQALDDWERQWPDRKRTMKSSVVALDGRINETEVGVDGTKKLIESLQGTVEAERSIVSRESDDLAAQLHKKEALERHVAKLSRTWIRMTGNGDINGADSVRCCDVGVQTRDGEEGCRKHASTLTPSEFLTNQAAVLAFVDA